jgi:hypothetical protein
MMGGMKTTLAVLLCCAVPALAQTSQPNCQINGTREISISCDYTPLSPSPAPGTGAPRIAINHAALSFRTGDDNWANVNLAFTRLDSTPVTEERTVYIEFDDDSGNNFIRRVLPSVDFRTLAKGRKTEFSEKLLIGNLLPGHYWVSLWIPSTDPSLKFDIQHNYLICSAGVPDQKSGLNRIAGFSVVR